MVLTNGVGGLNFYWEVINTVAEMQDWFADQTDGRKIPDSRSIRRRVSSRLM